MFVFAALVFASYGAFAQSGLAAESASALRAEGRFAEARDAAERALKATPNDLAMQNEEALASERIALDAIAQHRADDALADLLRARKYAPEHPKLLFDLGVLEDEMKLYRDADEALAEAERLQPGDPQVIYAVARVKLDLGQLAVAEVKMRAYLALKPEDASAHYGLGRIYRQGLELDKARVEFERCVALQPKQTEGYYQLGDTELQAGASAEALQNFSKTLERQPQHGGALAGSGIAYFKEKQYPQAIEFLQRAVAAVPDYQPGHYYLGLTLARMGRDAESKKELDIATRLAEQDNKQGANGLRLNEQAP